MTHGLSPASLTGAYLDWLLHLLAAPGRQLALAAAAHRPVTTAAGTGHRFAAPAWRQWPFQPMVQGFQLCEQWGAATTTGLPGVSPHHQRLVNFGARQWLDLLAPSNFFWTNPEAMQTAARMVREYLLGTRTPPNDLSAWSRDATRRPYRMHSEYLRSFYLNNALAHGDYLVGGRAVGLSDLRLPVFLVGTLKEHRSPWRSVYKLRLLADTEVTFGLTSGGHNAGIVSEHWHVGRSYRMAQRKPNGHYVDPDAWLAAAPLQQGSWWSAWDHWLSQRSGRRVAARSPAAADIRASLGDAPGRYVAT